MRKRSFKGAIAVLLLFFGIVGGGISLVIVQTNRIQQIADAEIKEMQEELQQSKRCMFVALENLSAGTILTYDNTEMIQALSETDADYFITDEAIGSVALVDIPANMPIMKTMCAKAKHADGLREFECNLIQLSSNLGSSDWVDVRIVYPNGEDYVVLAKKQLKNVSQAANNAFYWLSEEELLMLTSALLDAAQIPSTRVYTTKYLQPTIQNASVTDYPLNSYAYVLTGISPNVIDTSHINADKRSALEERLRQFLGENIDFGKGANWNNTKAPRDEDGNLITDSSTDFNLQYEDEETLVEPNSTRNEMTTNPEISNSDNNPTEVPVTTTEPNENESANEVADFGFSTESVTEGEDFGED